MIQILLALCVLAYAVTVQQRWIALALAILVGWLLRAGLPIVAGWLLHGGFA